jgi:putative iron-regulated protein
MISFRNSTILACSLLCSGAFAGAALADVTNGDVVKHYADIAEATYTDARDGAKTLHVAVNNFLENPQTKELELARSAWLAARIPYQQSEAFRFGNPIVDDWEGRVNSWPLDEGLIDYVDAYYGTENDENDLYVANVIANPTIAVNGQTVDASNITPVFLSSVLHEAGGTEANVATGYHAIEFLLWGQDLNGTKAGAGNRPHTDYALENCTNGNCDRRRAYLAAAVQLLVSDLEEMAANWGQNGAARSALLEKTPAQGVSAILTGMGSLSYGELAGERMKLGLLLGDPEEEHDCFSDNTHNSHYYDALGIQNVFEGTYTRRDGTKLTGGSLYDLVAAKDNKAALELRGRLNQTLDAMQVMVNRAETIESYDQMIAEGNSTGNQVIQAAIDGLIAQTRSIENAIVVLDLGGVALEGSDSLDNANAVFE